MIAIYWAWKSDLWVCPEKVDVFPIYGQENVGKIMRDKYVLQNEHIYIYIYIYTYIYIFVGQVFECWFFFTAKNWGRLSQLGLALQQSNIDGKSRLWRGKLLWFGDIPRYSSLPKSPKAVLSESLPKVAQKKDSLAISHNFRAAICTF